MWWIHTRENVKTLMDSYVKNTTAHTEDIWMVYNSKYVWLTFAEALVKKSAKKKTFNEISKKRKKNGVINW